jgi:hypothetical protein
MKLDKDDIDAIADAVYAKVRSLLYQLVGHKAFLAILAVSISNWDTTRITFGSRNVAIGIMSAELMHLSR